MSKCLQVPYLSKYYFPLPKNKTHASIISLVKLHTFLCLKHSGVLTSDAAIYYPNHNDLLFTMAHSAPVHLHEYFHNLKGDLSFSKDTPDIASAVHTPCQREQPTATFLEGHETPAIFLKTRYFPYFPSSSHYRAPSKPPLRDVL